MSARVPCLLILGLLSVCFSISTGLAPYYTHRDAVSGQGGVLMFLLGDSRRLLANEFFAKADAYYHAGYYPGIFDTQLSEHGGHLMEGAGQKDARQEQDHDANDDYLGPPKDWIDRFGRHFFPSKHRHLDKPGEAREILPWLKLSAEMDPHLVETYVVSAFWLREQLGKVDEAEAFLREGLRANPGNPEILLELGKVKAENRHDDATAGNLWELALQNLRHQSTGGGSTNHFLQAQVLGQLEMLEERRLHWGKAVEYLEMLKEISPFKSQLQEQIDELKTRRDGQQPPVKPGMPVPTPAGGRHAASIPGPGPPKNREEILEGFVVGIGHYVEPEGARAASGHPFLRQRA